MTPENLAYYLRGFAENSSEPPTREQWGVLRHAILSSTMDQPHVFFGGVTPPEIAALMDKGCSDCSPKKGSNPALPVLDESKLPPIEGG